MKGLDCDKLNYFGDLPMFYKFQGLKCLPIRLSVGKKKCFADYAQWPWSLILAIITNFYCEGKTKCLLLSSQHVRCLFKGKKEQCQF